jgi:RimJ/RimL family protein N-acetyltransferase
MRTQYPGPAYRIETPRLVVRCWEPTDIYALRDAVIASLEHLRPWMPWARHGPEPLEDQIQRIRLVRSEFDAGKDFVYGIWNLDESQFLGSTGLHTRRGEGIREIGYWIHKDHIGQGLATEASQALIRVAFEVDSVHRVEIRHDPANVRSAAIPRKLGFTQEAVLRKQLRVGSDSWRDTAVWSLLAGEYPSSPSASLPITATDVIGRSLMTL